MDFRLSQWFKDIDSDAMNKLSAFNSLLIQYNKRIQLVSPKTIPYADVIHFSDSIYASRLVRPSLVIKPEIYDVGSGNGFPGIVFGILYPEVSVILLDTDSVKCDFLKQAVSELSLSNIKVVNQAFEKVPADSIPNAISRGYASITKSLLSARKVIVKGGAYFHMKSSEWSKEVAEMPTQICSIWSPELVGEYSLPLGEFRFAVVKTTKIA